MCSGVAHMHADGQADVAALDLRRPLDSCILFKQNSNCRQAQSVNCCPSILLSLSFHEQR